MNDLQRYQCENCGAQRSAAAGPPECCGREMQPAEPLPVCETTFTAEHSRLGDDGGPCDDGRGGAS